MDKDKDLKDQWTYLAALGEEIYQLKKKVDTALDKLEEVMKKRKLL